MQNPRPCRISRRCAAEGHRASCSSASLSCGKPPTGRMTVGSEWGYKAPPRRCFCGARTDRIYPTGRRSVLQPTEIRNPDYFHKVVDCQWACPAHTPVPEYIRLIAAGRYDDAYLVNWESNVFPGILGRTCDRPCEPACRRGRVEENNGAGPDQSR